MLVLAGSGHIMFGSGIPNRIQRRIDAEQYSVLVSDDHLPVSEDIADFLVMSVEQSLEPSGLIGAILDTDGGMLTIRGFSKNSAVKDAGVEKGAVIIGVNDEKVKSFSDFKLAIMDKQRGDSIELHIWKMKMQKKATRSRSVSNSGKTSGGTFAEGTCSRGCHLYEWHHN